LPLGTIEWHGEHLPLGADRLQSKSFMKTLANEAGGIILPMYFLEPDKPKMIGGKQIVGTEKRIESFLPKRVLSKQINP